MRLAAVGLLLAALWQAGEPVKPELRDFQYRRGLATLAGAGAKPGPSCAVLDGELYAHSPTLADVRLYAGTQEVPYALSTSQTAAMGDPAKVLNAGLCSGHVVFALEMPSRPYSEVQSGSGGDELRRDGDGDRSRRLQPGHGTALGSFTIV